MVPTWVRSLAASRSGEHRADTLRRYWTIVDRILDEPATRVAVLATDAAGRTIHAWAASTGGVLHYAYVPLELRGHGLARRAITEVLGGYADRIDITHDWPFTSTRFVRRRHPLLRAA